MSTPSNAGSTPVSVVIGAPVIWVAPDASLNEIADTLTNQSIGAVLVEGNGKPAGVVSERDLVGALSDRLDAATARATDIAETTLVWCDASATVAEAAALMMDRYVRHVLVEEEGRLVGIVSARDLLGTYLSGEALPGDEDP